MSVNLNTPKPGFQDSLRSKVVRTALEEVDAAANDLQTQIDALSTAASGSETVLARDGFESLRDRLRSGYQGTGNVIISGGAVEAQDTPDLTVKVGAVEALVDGVGINLGVGRTWARVTTTATITEASHTLSNGDSVHIEQTSDAAAIPLGSYIVANATTDTFDITVPDAGGASGTVSFGRDTGAVTAPGTGTELTYVTVNSDGTISILTPTSSPIFPTLADSNCVVGGLVVKSTTTSLNDNVEVFNFKQSTKGYSDLYITAGTLTQGETRANNIIIDGAVSLDYDLATSFQITPFSPASFVLKCEGNFYTTTGSTITVNSESLIYENGNPGEDGESSTDATVASAGGSGGSQGLKDYLPSILTGAKGGSGGDGASAGVSSDDVNAGGGGGGGGSIVASGGSGGAGGNYGNAGTSTESTSGAGANAITSFLMVFANNILIQANITSEGLDGSDGITYNATDREFGGGGGGGSSAGNVFLISKNGLEITSACTISLTGGDAGDGASATTGTRVNAGGGGGGGGAGGCALLRYKTITLGGSIITSGGSGGAGGAASGGSIGNSPGSVGSAGGNGFTNSVQYDITTSTEGGILPIAGIYNLDL